MVQRGTTTMDRELPVRLTDDERLQYSETISEKVVHIGMLRKKRREDLRSINALIESELDEVQRIARLIVDGIEQRKQGDIKFTDEVVPSQGEAQAALSEIEKRAKERPTQYHRDGKICRTEVCRRKHLTIEQCKANDIVPEGEPLVPDTSETNPPDGEAPAIETKEPTDETVTVEDETEKLETEANPGNGHTKSNECVSCGDELQTATERIKNVCEKCQLAKPGAAIESTDDDPRPRCRVGSEVLSADDVELCEGICRACLEKATAPKPADGTAEEAHA